MSQNICSDQENVVRAIRSSDWDEVHERWSSNLFRQSNTSVSRLCILNLKKIFKIFCKDLHKPPVHKVVKGGEISVGKLKVIGKNNLNNKGMQDEVTIAVVPSPIKDNPTLTDNPAHAEIQTNKKITRTLAFEIIKQLRMHDAPDCGWQKIFTRIIIVALTAIAVVLLIS